MISMTGAGKHASYDKRGKKCNWCEKRNRETIDILLTIDPRTFWLTKDESKRTNHFLQSSQPITSRLIDKRPKTSQLRWPIRLTTRDIYTTYWRPTIYLTVKRNSAQVVEKSVNIISNKAFQISAFHKSVQQTKRAKVISWCLRIFLPCRHSKVFQVSFWSSNWLFGERNKITVWRHRSPHPWSAMDKISPDPPPSGAHQSEEGRPFYQ